MHTLRKVPRTALFRRTSLVFDPARTIVSSTRIRPLMLSDRSSRSSSFSERRDESKDSLKKGSTSAKANPLASPEEMKEINYDPFHSASGGSSLNTANLPPTGASVHSPGQGPHNSTQRDGTVPFGGVGSVPEAQSTEQGMGTGVGSRDGSGIRPRVSGDKFSAGDKDVAQKYKDLNNFNSTDSSDRLRRQSSKRHENDAQPNADNKHINKQFGRSFASSHRPEDGNWQAPKSKVGAGSNIPQSRRDKTYEMEQRIEKGEDDGIVPHLLAREKGTPPRVSGSEVNTDVAPPEFRDPFPSSPGLRAGGSHGEASQRVARNESFSDRLRDTATGYGLKNSEKSSYAADSVRETGQKVMDNLKAKAAKFEREHPKEAMSSGAGDLAAANASYRGNSSTDKSRDLSGSTIREAGRDLKEGLKDAKENIKAAVNDWKQDNQRDSGSYNMQDRSSSDRSSSSFGTDRSSSSFGGVSGSTMNKASEDLKEGFRHAKNDLSASEYRKAARDVYEGARHAKNDIRADMSKDKSESRSFQDNKSNSSGSTTFGFNNMGMNDQSLGYNSSSRSDSSKFGDSERLSGREVKEAVKESAYEAKEVVKEKAQHAKEAVKEKASGLMDKIKDTFNKYTN